MLLRPLLLEGGVAEEAPKRRERRPRPRSDDAVVVESVVAWLVTLLVNWCP